MSSAKENNAYEVWQDIQHQLWEKKCLRCAACCGLFDGDPCLHLKKGENGEGYFCEIYENRFGLRKTVSGKTFRCVPIRDILHLSWPGDHCCGYKKGR
ncbi:MAG: hypothetical protein KC713_05285 [Candidatus Omnitrophica bacterium]|nr:hypothetical protein [Candidatus Omnitrophota bacterium]